MANKEQLRIVKSGVDEWNTWRQEHPDIIYPDLSQAELSKANLNDINFNGVNLTQADLRGATFFRADLARATLVRADLSDAVLFECDLSNANLVNANFTSAFLNAAKLNNVDLSNANFSDANLSRANLSGATARSTNFENCGMGFTILTNLNLSNARNLQTVKHQGPSSIGIDTIYLSEGNIPEIFMREAGIPEPFITHAKSLVAAMTPLQFYSCFISYSHKDKEFAQILYHQLQRAGIRCWLDEHQLLPGDDIYHQVDRAIRLWDKLLLCCSEHSLHSWWVDHEIGTAFEKEQQLSKERGLKVQVLIPLNLDDYLFNKWQSGYAAQVRRRLAADFVNIQSTPKKFDQQIDKLIKALRADEGSREAAPASIL